ncbi:hypothetical protein BDQ17DRAFT_887816 [Cyathus striatus]|nr:hypothetical protein BDQ17DRAFT_887816 [Cyathus striatus]
MMGLSILDIPHDVLLEIATYLELGDVFSLVSTCATLRKFYDSRSLWISVLSRTGQNQRLAYPIYLPISDASLDELHRISSHAYRLKKNLQSSEPKFKRAAKAKFVCKEQMDFVAVVSGTGILCLYKKDSKSLVVCDMDGVDDAEQGMLELEIGDSLLLQSFLPLESRHLMALITGADGTESHMLNVISLSHHAGTPTSLERLYTLDLPFNPLDVFMYGEFVGIIQEKKDGINTTLTLHVVDYIRGRKIETSLDIGFPVPDDVFIELRFFDDCVFFVVLTVTYYRVCSFSSSFLSTLFSPYTSTPPKPLMTEHFYWENPSKL